MGRLGALLFAVILLDGERGRVLASRQSPAKGSALRIQEKFVVLQALVSRNNIVMI